VSADLVTAAIGAGGLLLGTVVGAVADRFAAARRRQGGRPDEPAEVQPFLTSLETFGESVPPVWTAHLTTARTQMDTAVTGLATTFADIVGRLDGALASSAAAFSGGHAQVFDDSRSRLGSVVDTLDGTVERKRRAVEGLRSLLGLIEDMRTMTSEVTRIASQTHLLALNAAIEAQRVGETGKAFTVVAVEVRQLAERSGETGQRIGEKATEVSDAVAAAVSLAETQADQEAQLVSEARGRVQSVLDDLLELVERLHGASTDLSRATTGIQDDIGRSLVEFQFADRLSQTLGHLAESIDELPGQIRTSLRDAPGSVAPLDAPGLLERLKSNYTMVEEHEVHSSGEAVAVRDTEITFF
jgi:methyl-accepting chemotaxis protein